MNVLDCVFLAISLGRTDNKAPVPPVSVPAVLSAVVAISTLPATVVLAFTNVAHVPKSTQAPHSEYVIFHSDVKPTINPFVLGVAHNAASLAVASA